MNLSNFKNMTLDYNEILPKKEEMRQKHNLDLKNKELNTYKKTCNRNVRSAPAWNNNTSVKPLRKATSAATPIKNFGGRSTCSKKNEVVRKVKVARPLSVADVRMSLPCSSDKPRMNFSLTANTQLNGDLYLNNPPTGWQPKGKENKGVSSRNATPVLSASSLRVKHLKTPNSVQSLSRVTPNVTSSLVYKTKKPALNQSAKLPSTRTPVFGIDTNVPLHPDSNIPRYTPVMSSSSRTTRTRNTKCSITTPKFHSHSLTSKLPVRKL